VFSLLSGQLLITVSSPQYTVVHYILMAASLFLLASLVLGFLLLVRKDCARCQRSGPRSPARRRQQLIRVKPKLAGPDTPEFNVTDRDLIVEDLDGHLIRSVAPSKRTTPTPR
jgi:hypothetical protein